MSKKNYSKPWFKKKQPQVNFALIKHASTFDNNPKYGYYGFKLYFPEQNSEDVDTTIVKCVKTFEAYIRSNETKFDLANIESTHVFQIDYNDLISDDALCNNWPEFRSEIIDNTKFCLDCISLAVHQTINLKFNDGDPNKIIYGKLINFYPIQDLKDVRVNVYGKLASVQGTVIRAAHVKIQCVYMAFYCRTCTGEQVVKQNDNSFTLPTSCPSEGCKARSNFVPLLSSRYTRTCEYQTIKIQEIVGNERLYESGRVPRTLECRLTNDLVNSCIPGDDITITGVIQVHNNNEAGKQQNLVLSFYMDGLTVVNNKKGSQSSCGASEGIKLDDGDHEIQEIKSEPDLFRKLVHSLSPHIYGHDLVKAGLLLALIGGTKSAKMRAQSHVLMVGDPGLGKSEMLQSCYQVAPRGVYVCGNTSTTSGLTVTMVRESGVDYSLEAGALLLADQGCCCIDEFDKMKAQHAALLEAMEQQSISVAKAGTVCSLPTRATILAAANPVQGHYDKAKTVAENLRISSPMLSRFDLIFILLDQPNEEMDQMLTKHVLARFSGKRQSFLNLSTRVERPNDNLGLKERLRLQPGEEIDPISQAMLRKYIAYAQKFINVKLSNEAQVVLKEFYLKLRNQYKKGDSTPITTRQLISLNRLTQARANAELRHVATKQDALEVIEILKESQIDVIVNDVGMLEKSRASKGPALGFQKKVMKLLSLMKEQMESEGKSIFSKEEISELSESVCIEKSKFFTVLSNLNNEGIILHKGGDKYQLVSSYCM